MVQFKVKTIANQDTTLHATYPDLYDGKSPYLKVGGNFEPKKALIRYTISDKPVFGDALLSGAEVGFYSTGMTASANFPTFNIYKLKTSPNDANNWSGEGSIRMVNRGKQIIGIIVTTGGTETGSYVKVLNHQLNTGDRIYHSPYTNTYKDVIVAGITPETAYYAIKIDRDNFAFASSLANALSETRVTLVAFSSDNYVPGTSVAALASGTGPWGYIRSETYSQDIHVVTAKPKDSETLSENFDGSAYRTSNLGYESVQRNVFRRSNPHVTSGGALWDAAEGTTRVQGSEYALLNENDSNLMDWYGEDGKVYLTDYESKADGKGWWQTEIDAGRWKGGYEYVPKTSPPTSMTPNPNVKWDVETATSQTPYGDEVTPANSMFHIVRGASEYSSAPTEGEGDNVMDATGAVRFSSEVKLTGGQACNVYQFWRKAATDIEYIEDKQECLMIYKGLPFPTCDSTMMDYSVFGHGQFPIADGEQQHHIPFGSSDWTLRMKINFKKLEKAYATGTSSTQDTITARRGFHVILATTPPSPEENFYDYVYRLSNGGTWKAASEFGNDGHGFGFSIINTDTHLKYFALSSSTLDTTNKDVTWTGITHAESGGGATSMNEGEWYDINIVIPTATATSNNGAAVVIRNADDENVCAHPSTTSSHLLGDIGETQISNNGGFWYGEDVANTDEGMRSKWPQHLSIWATNTVSNYVSATSTNGTDWMSGEEDRDTENNIFIDNISLTGVNFTHSNATVHQEGRASRSKISITSSDTYKSIFNIPATHGNLAASSFEEPNITRRSDNIILMGFEDPSQISSAYDIEPSWRYIFWNGYSSANLASDNKLTFTAGDTLPATTGIEGSGSAVPLPVADDEWFNAVGSGQTGADWREHDLAGAAYIRYSMLGGHDDGDDTTGRALYADAGMPIAFSSYASQMAPTVFAFYSDNNHTTGASISDEVVTTRNLIWNKTRDIDDTADDAEDTLGLYGTQQPMFSMSPSIGAVFRPDGNGEATAIASSRITIQNGPNGGNGQYWRTGHPVVYYNNDNTSITMSGGGVSATGKFNDNPIGPTTGKFWVVRDTTTDNRTFKLAPTEKDALAGTNLLTISGTPAGNHILYDYDYYVNRKYFMDGFSSKGLSRLILQPTYCDAGGGNEGNAILNQYLSTAQQGFMKWETDNQRFADGANVDLTSTTVTTANLRLTKREHLACAAKVLEVMDKPNQTTPTSITLRVDTVEPLYSVPNTTYKLFVLAESGTDSYKSNVTITIIDKETIEVDNWDGKADDNSTTIWNIGDGKGNGSDDSNRDTTLARLWIGPEKYWIGMMVSNRGGYNAATAGALPNKTYESVCIVSPFGGERDDYTTNGLGQSAVTPAWGTPGATYNESLYNADKVSGVRAAYVNQWKPSPNLDSNETIYDLQDFGFGSVTEDKERRGGENGCIGGYAANFTPRSGQINKIKIPTLFSAGDVKEEGDTIDIAIQTETANSSAVMSISSTENETYPKPFLLTVFEDELPSVPADFEVEPNEKDAFLPEFTWTAGDGDLWYGLIHIDDTPIYNQYHRAIFHAPFNEDLRTVATSYAEVYGHYYSTTTSPVIYGYRDAGRRIEKSGVHEGSTLGSTEKFGAAGVSLYDTEEGLAGNSKYFTRKGQLEGGSSYTQWDWDLTASSSDINYPIDEMTIVSHIVPTNWPVPLSVTGCTYNSGGPRVTHSAFTTSSIGVGDLVSGSGITAGAYVATVVDTNHFDLSVAPASGSYSSQTVTITPRHYIAAFNNNNNGSAAFGSWGIYLDANGRINAYVGANPATTHPTHTSHDTGEATGTSNYVQLQSTTQVPADGSIPTSVILTVDTHLHAGNVKLYINGRMEDQSGLRGTLSLNNWPTNASGIGGQAIFYDNAAVAAAGSTYSTSNNIVTHTAVAGINVGDKVTGTNIPDGAYVTSITDTTHFVLSATPTGTQSSPSDVVVTPSQQLFIGSKSQESETGRSPFEGKIEEFVWYDNIVNPVVPQSGSFILEKPMKELVVNSTNSSSKAYTAKLFIKDYHNIRGKTSGEVAASSQVSFKKAAFELYT